jgi:hypothetical protein
VTFIQAHESAWILVGAAMFGVAAIAGVLALAIGAVVGLFGLVAVGAIAVGAAIGAGVAYIESLVPKWFDAGHALVMGLVDGLLSGLGPLGAALETIKTGADLVSVVQHGTPPPPLVPVASTGGVTQSLAGLSDSSFGTKANYHPTAVTIHKLEVNTPASEDPQKQATLIGSAVRAEMTKVFNQHGG